MSRSSEKDLIAVVGAGIVGISIALELRTRGLDVCVFDRLGIGESASKGNAGAFAFSDIIPLATPGIMRKAPGWLLDPLGPLSVVPTYAPRIAPWMVRFWRSSWRDRFAAAVEAQASLMKLSQMALERQITATCGQRLIRAEGQIQLYEGEGEFRASLPAWEMRRAHGIRFDLLESPEAIAELQPGISPRFTHAGFTPDWLNTVDPSLWVDHLASRFRERGGVIEISDVLELRQEPRGIRLIMPDRSLLVRTVVVAAGAWSHHLTRPLGDWIPLETERGYNTTLPEGAFDLRTHITFASHGFVASRIGKGVRIGGAVEFGGLLRGPDYRRSDILLRKASEFLPSLDPRGGTRWMGFRPSTPDSLPVIGPSPNARDAIYAFGHGHLGLTQSAGTAELVADLVVGKAPALSIAPFAPERFRTRTKPFESRPNLVS